MNNRLGSTLNLKVQVQPDVNVPKISHHTESIDYYKKHGYKQINIYLSKEEDQYFTTICELLGMAKKDLAARMVKEAMISYKDKIASLIELKKQYEEQMALITLA